MNAQMSLESLKKEINSMDVMTDDFLQLYLYIADKYYKIEKPDDYQQAVNMLRMWIDASCGNFEEHVICVTKIVTELFKMRDKKVKAVTGMLGFSDETYYFDIYTTENQKDDLGRMISKTVGAMKSGQFGKNYFKKEGKK